MLVLNTDFNVLRTAFISAIMMATGLNQEHVVTEEAEAPNSPRPSLPYMAMKITTPAARYGDDTKQNIPSTDLWTSSGPRKMTVSFDAYGKSHEDAYNLMTLWQTALDEETTQEALRKTGIAVLIIGTVADVSILLNTAYEGRAHMDSQFGIAVGVQSDLGRIDTVPVVGTVTTDQDEIKTVS